MIYFGLVCVLLHLAQGRDRFNFETQGGNITTRFGGKYLGIVTSFDQISSTVAIAQNTAPGTVGADGVTQCGCIMASACINRNVQGRVDVRVVTNAPSGVVCPQGYVYCCTQTASFACGFPFEVPIEGLQPDAGEALMGEFPWSAMIRLVNGTYMGGGTLVSSRHIITVAHNVFGKGLPLAAFRVRLGDWDREGEYEPLDHLDIPVTDAVPHPQYDPASLTNDIAVLTLGLTVPLLTMPVPHINAICMPGQNVPFTGRRCFVAGWGREQFNGPYPDVIKKVDVPIITAAECQARIRAAGIPNFNLDPASFVCAGGEPNKDACTGDGGNALACLVDGQFYVAGLAVGGIRCGMANVPGLYTNVPSFANWINAIIRPPVQIVPRTG